MQNYKKNATILIVNTSNNSLLAFHIVLVFKRRFPMSTTSTDLTKNSTSITSKFTEEFEKYLKKQSLKTTFNGCEIETFSWYKTMLGIGY